MNRSVFDGVFLRDILKDYMSKKDTFDIVCDAIKRTHKGDISRGKMYAMARDLIEGVRKAGTSDFNADNLDAEKVLNEFFGSLKNGRSEEKRLRILKSIHFGLNLHTTEEMRGLLEEGRGAMALFDEYCENHGMTADYYEKAIRDFFAEYHVSPQMTEYFVRELTDSNAVEFSAKTGKDAERLMCIIVARSYEAAGGAKSVGAITDGVHSRGREASAVGDGIRKGYAKKESFELFDYDDELNAILIYFAAVAVVLLVMYLTESGVAAAVTAIVLVIAIPVLICLLDEFFGMRVGVREAEREYQKSMTAEFVECIDEDEDEYE